MASMISEYRQRAPVSPGRSNGQSRPEADGSSDGERMRVFLCDGVSTDPRDQEQWPGYGAHRRSDNGS